MTDVLFEQTQLVPLSALKTYEKNPRRGNVQAIAESLSVNKQYRPIVVQKSTKKILAGNHTFKAAQQLGWKEIAVVMVDVTDEEAVRIMLADNRTNDLAEYDNRVLAELLRDLGDSAGTGYNATDVENLLATMDSTVEAIAVTSDGMAESVLLQNDELVGLPEVVKAAAVDPSDIEAAGGDDLGGVYTLKEDMVWKDTYGIWDIPKLDPDMMIEELPSPLTTWAGSATRDMAWDGYWLYNWGIDSTSGMDDLSKIMLAFYTWDDYFECWWNDSARYLSKAINSKIKYAITPNYSQDDMPRAESLWQVYRSRWIGRYLQEIGIRVMPDLETRIGEPDFRKLVVDSLPHPLPWAATQVQNLVSQTRTGNKEDPARRKLWIDQTKAMVREAQIENLLIYCNTSRWDEVRQWFHGVGVHLEFLPTRIELLSVKQKANKRDPKRL